MAEIRLLIQVNLPDDWMEQIVNRLRNDPEAEWVEIVRCKDCNKASKCYRDVVMRSRGGGYIYYPLEFCSAAERRTE